VNSFDAFLPHLGRSHDPRRAEGKLHLSAALCFAVFHSGDCDRTQLLPGIRTFIKVHLKRLNEKALKIDWKRRPVHTAIRYILQGAGSGRCRESLYARG
jgi:hypothetical protein